MEKELQQAKEEAAAALEAARKAGDVADNANKYGPKKKKTKKNDKREGRKWHKEARATEANRNVGVEDSGKAAGIKSNLKTGRFRNTGTTSNVKPTQLFAGHDHKYKQEYINTPVKLKDNNKHAEVLKMLVSEMKKR